MKAAGASGVASALPAVSLNYYGGPVMQANTRAIPIFWEPSHLQDNSRVSHDAVYISLIERFLQDFGGSGLYDNLTQYYQQPGPQFIVDSFGVTVAVIDTTPYPKADALGCGENGLKDCVSNRQIAAEVARVVTRGSLPRGLSTFYPVFTPLNEESCVDALNCFLPQDPPPAQWTYCAYHSFFTQQGQPVIYATLPNIESYGALRYCGENLAYPNYPPFDVESPILIHEASEAITDPEPSNTTAAWYDNYYGEIGDICMAISYPFDTVHWNSHQYVIQKEWNNTGPGGCASGGWEHVALGAPNGPGGSSLALDGTLFGINEPFTLSFIDSAGNVTPLGSGTSDNQFGNFSQVVTIPSSAAPGRGVVNVAGMEPELGAAADFFVGSATHRPDCLISASSIGPWSGNGVHNRTGARQTLKASVRYRSSVSFWIEVQNDGSVPDTYVIRGGKGRGGFTVAYRIDGRNVTTRIRAGTYKRTLAPGSALMLEVTIVPMLTATRGSVLHNLVTVTSLTDRRKLDTVGMITVYR